MSESTVELVQIEGEDQPRGFCWCGCGTPTVISKRTNRPLLQYKDIACRYINGHHHVSDLSRYEIDENGCWIWTGSRDGRGYGKVQIKSRTHRCPRLFWELHVGPIPDGLHIDHLCRVKACVNPAHLEPVTQEENNRRMLEATRRGPYGVACMRGHRWDEGNERIDKRGCRSCIACRRLTDRRKQTQATA